MATRSFSFMAGDSGEDDVGVLTPADAAEDLAAFRGGGEGDAFTLWNLVLPPVCFSDTLLLLTTNNEYEF